MDCDVARLNNDSVVNVFLSIIFKGLNWDGSPTRIQNGDIYKYMQILRNNVVVYPAHKLVNRSDLFIDNDIERHSNNAWLTSFRYN